MSFAPAISHPHAGLFCAMAVGIVTLHERKEGRQCAC